MALLEVIRAAHGRISQEHPSSLGRADVIVEISGRGCEAIVVVHDIVRCNSPDDVMNYDDVRRSHIESACMAVMKNEAR